MKIYSLNTKQIETILKPFTNNYTIFSTGLKKEDLINFNYEKSFNLLNSRLLQKTLFLIANPEEIKYSTFNFTTSNQESFLIENPEHLYASIYLGKNVDFNIVGEEDYCFKLFGTINNIKETSDIVVDDDENYFTWKYNKKLFESSMDDVDFRLNKFEKMRSNDIADELSKIPENSPLWFNSKFITKSFALAEIGRKSNLDFIIPENLIFNFNFLKFLKDEFSQTKEKDTNYYIRLLCLNIDNLKKLKNDNINEFEKYQKEFFSTNEDCLSIIYEFKYSYRTSLFPDIFQLIHPSVLTNHQFLKALEDEINPSLAQSFPKESFKDPYIFNLFLKNAEKTSWYAYNSDNPFFLTLLEDKNKLFELIQNNSLKISIDNLYNILSDEMKDDKKLMNLLISKTPQIYYKIPKHLQKDIDIFKHFIKNRTNDVPFNIEEDFLIDIMNTDKKLFKEICHKVPTLTIKKWCLNEFKDDIDLFKLLHQNLNQNKVKKICKNNKDAITLIKQNYEFYNYLPDNFKKENDVVFAFLNKVENAQEYLKNGLIKQIPSEKLFNRNFAFKVIEVTNSLQNIPDLLLHDKKFVMELFAKIDSNELYVETFTEEINNFFASAKIEENYSDFLVKYLNKIQLSDSFKNAKIKKKVSI